MRNPHFDDGRVIWKDKYSGLYEPVPYDVQFDNQWQLFLENRPGFVNHTGVETDDVWIDDRVFDLTGVHGLVTQNELQVPRNMGGRQNLSLRFSPEHFQDKRILDAGCGAGRWTKALQALGGSVKSIDVSEHGLKSVRQFNSDVEAIDLFSLAEHKRLQGTFDFTICWGVVMCTHDPWKAFQNVASTVAQGGELYVMVYAPTYHNNPEVQTYRKQYHSLKTYEEKMAYVFDIADSEENAINYLDMLNTFYNWVVEEETIHQWFKKCGFSETVTLNFSDEYPVAYHVLGRKRRFAPPMFDDAGNKVHPESSYEIDEAVLLTGPFGKEEGNAWTYHLPQHLDTSDGIGNLSRSKLVLLENDVPLWHRHEIHDEIRKTGMGRYSHWDTQLIFSTSDNSDPNTNGKKYKILFSETA